MYDRKKFRSAQNVTDVSFFVVSTMELLTHGGEHHEIGDEGRLMMTMATDSPLRCPEQIPD